MDGTTLTARRRRLSVLTGRAILAESTGATDEAAGLWGEAAAGWLAYGNVLERARAVLGWGRCLRGADPERGATLMREAAAAFRGLGARSLLQDSRAVLAEIEEVIAPG